MAVSCVTITDAAMHPGHWLLKAQSSMSNAGEFTLVTFRTSTYRVEPIGLQ